MNDQKYSPMLPFGAGIAIGGLGLLALIELWPLLLIGGGLVLAFKGLNVNQECKTIKENSIHENLE